jgi:hypothetical protein
MTLIRIINDAMITGSGDPLSHQFVLGSRDGRNDEVVFVWIRDIRDVIPLNDSILINDRENKCYICIRNVLHWCINVANILERYGQFSALALKTFEGMQMRDKTIDDAFYQLRRRYL